MLEFSLTVIGIFAVVYAVGFCILTRRPRGWVKIIPVIGVMGIIFGIFILMLAVHWILLVGAIAAFLFVVWQIVKSYLF